MDYPSHFGPKMIDEIVLLSHLPKVDTSKRTDFWLKFSLSEKWWEKSLENRPFLPLKWVNKLKNAQY